MWLIQQLEMSPFSFVLIRRQGGGSYSTEGANVAVIPGIEGQTSPLVSHALFL